MAKNTGTVEFLSSFWAETFVRRTQLPEAYAHTKLYYYNNKKKHDGEKRKKKTSINLKNKDFLRGGKNKGDRISKTTYKTPRHR